jgi:hypothetical protein
LLSATLVFALQAGAPADRAGELILGPIDDGQFRVWAARSDWSLPPAAGEVVEWRGERWRVVEAAGEFLRVRSREDECSDRVVPTGEARLLGLSRALNSGEVLSYRLHAVRE